MGHGILHVIFSSADQCLPRMIALFPSHPQTPYLIIQHLTLFFEH
jgi:hypothetical protein